MQNPHVKNKLRSYQVKNLKDIFGHTIQEDQKQKISTLDFGVTNHSETKNRTTCSINAIRDKGCFKYGSEDHFVKKCPLSQLDNTAHKGPHSDLRNTSNNDCTADRVMEPLTRLFADLVKQLKLLTPSGQGGNPKYDGKTRNDQQTDSNSGHKQHANGHYQKREVPSKDCHHRPSFQHNGHQWGIDGHRGNFSQRCHARINEVESGSECNSECLGLSDIKEHLEEAVEPVPTLIKN